MCFIRPYTVRGKLEYQGQGISQEIRISVLLAHSSRQVDERIQVMHLAGVVGSLLFGRTPFHVYSYDVIFLAEQGPQCDKRSTLSFAAKGASLEAGLWVGTLLVGLRVDIPQGLCSSPLLL